MFSVTRGFMVCPIRAIKDIYRQMSVKQHPSATLQFCLKYTLKNSLKLTASFITQFVF